MASLFRIGGLSSTFKSTPLALPARRVVIQQKASMAKVEALGKRYAGDHGLNPSSGKLFNNHVSFPLYRSDTYIYQRTGEKLTYRVGFHSRPSGSSSRATRGASTRWSVRPASTSLSLATLACPC
jgi:hypothetical protein